MLTRGDGIESGQQESHRTPDRTTNSGFSHKIRAAGAVVGSVLLIRGLQRRSLRGTAMVVAGCWLVVRGVRTQIALGGGPASRAPDHTPTASRSTVIRRPADELYEAWQDPDRLSAVGGDIVAVTAPTADRLRWTVNGPFGRTVSWETRVIEAGPGSELRLETTADAAISGEGTVHLQPTSGDRGTRVTLSVDLNLPGGSLTDVAERRFGGVLEKPVGRTLHRFKALAETGEVPTLAENPSARGAGDLL